ncbi:cytochrome P450 2D1-like [Haliotis rufescens]|uniref:cytochrome P450 2D1-like n=1 Tax=Haliotis rufescens TaxID=6454 RepID=UPI00201FA0A8|nr:cytochrome P450 2D1-like [Haliotis rufescens]
MFLPAPNSLRVTRGVGSTSGELWREQRRFALNTLREFGAGRNIMEDKIHEEISQFLEAFETERGQGFDCTRLVQNAVSNVVCSTMLGKRFEYTDPLFVTYLKAIDKNVANVEKYFQEIQENIGQSRRPSMKDKTNLPYVEATIMEVLRRSDIAPTALPHTVPHDVQFRGYTFPKGVLVILMLDSVLQDPDVGGDPENFRPDRFLDDTGKIVKKEEFIPFSLGRRACLGESMARMELFLFLTTMIQRFKFVPVDDQMPSLDGIMGVTHSPRPFLMKAIPRV